MSEVLERPVTSAEGARPRTLGKSLGRVAAIAGVIVLLLIPFYAGQGLLVAGLSVMAAAVGAIGLNILFGAAGQLSLGHAFFIAVGTYGYAFLAGEPGGIATPYGGWGWPPMIAAVAAILLAGALGLAFAPVSSRVSGLYLGVASLALVVIGQHVFTNWQSVTGGSNGRAVEPFQFLGLAFANTPPGETAREWFGVPMGRNELLWFLFAVILLITVFIARRLLRGPTGRALRMVRDNATAAQALGVNVRAYKAWAFTLSSIYAGTAGVMLALVLGNPVPRNFGLALSISYLAMVVIGGLGSVGGSIAGATFVVGLPYVLTTYGANLPFVSAAGSGGLDPGVLTKFAYGAAIVAVLLLQPGGLAGMTRNLRGVLQRHARPASETNV